MIGVAGNACGALTESRTAEVQINLCEPPERVATALGLTGDAPHTVWYFDTRELELLRRGLVFRLRQSGAVSDLTMKVARQDCEAIAPVLIPPADGKCEYDLHGESMQGAVSLSRHLDAGATAALLDGRPGLADALSATQIRFLRAHAGRWPLPAAIGRLGPVSIEAYRRTDERFVVEAWSLPGGEHYLEISQKSSRGEAHRVRNSLLERLARAGVAVCSDQSSQSSGKLRRLAR